jgi:hypothetical protein
LIKSLAIKRCWPENVSKERWIMEIEGFREEWTEKWAFLPYFFNVKPCLVCNSGMQIITS